MSKAIATRTGRVLLKVSSTPARYETFAVQEWPDGEVVYHLGTDHGAQTADGWVSLPADQIDNITWDAKPA